MSDERETRDLEARVRELEATVETLTSELVDATERIRELEGALDAEEDIASGTNDGEDARDTWVPAAEAVHDGDDANRESGEEESVRDRDGIIVA